MNYKWMTAATFALTVILVSLSSFRQNDSGSNPSNTLDVSMLDHAIKPGDDFYEFVNGKWIAQNPIPETESRWGVFNQLRDLSRETVHNILESAALSTTAKGSITQKVGDLYYSGMDSTAIEKAGITPLMPWLQMIEKVSTKDDLIVALAKLHKTGANPLFGVYVDADSKNSNQNILTLYQSGLGLPDRDYYFRTDEKSKLIQNKYHDYIAELYDLMKIPHEVSVQYAEQIVQIETMLANSSMTRVEQRDPYASYNKMTLDELISKYPNINWKLYFEEMGFPAFKELIVAQPKFLEEANRLVSEKSMDEWRVYLRFHFLNNAANLISSDFENADFGFYKKTMEGIEKMDPRWKRVSTIANGTMGEAIGQEYVKVAFSPEAKQKTIILVNDLKTAFAQRIDQLEWMSAETKAFAKQKLSTIMVKVGYPDKWKDYSALNIDRGPFVLNVFRCVEFELNRMIARTGTPVDRTLWGMSPQTVNAYYNPSNNEIVFPAAILQPPFFDAGADDAINYGGIGAVIGHEITHGFDDQGRQFDADGNLKSWWTSEDEEKFNARAGQLSDHYETYNPVDTLHINGQLTLGENIADLGGLTISYYAFQLHKKDRPQPEKIDGYSPDQRFFLNFAQIWRGAYRDDAMRQQLLTNVHSPGKYRVLGVLSNMTEWYEVFNIQPTDKMYIAPERRVNLW